MGILKKQTPNRQRQSNTTIDSSFRRGNAVPSRRQLQEKQARQLSLQRQETLIQKVNRQRRRHKSLAIVAGLLLIAVLFRLSVSGVNVKATYALPESKKVQYEKHLLGYVGEHAPFKQGWLVNKAAMEKDFLTAFPEVSAVAFSSRAPIITTWGARLEPRTPLFSWSDVSKEQRYLDSSGTLFVDNYTSVKAKDIIAVKDESGAVLDSGSSALAGTTTATIGELPIQLKPLYPKLKSKVIKQVVIPSSTRELRVYIEGERYYVKISTERPLGEQTGELKQVLGHLKRVKKTPTQYIDVRLKNKVFYK